MFILKFLLLCAVFALPLNVSSETLIYSEDPQSSLVNQLTQDLLKCNCVVATDTSSLIKAINTTDQHPIFTIGITAASIHEIQEKHPERQLVAIYAEPDPSALITLGSVIFNKHSLALFYSNRTNFVINQIEGVRLIKTDKSHIRRELSRLTNIYAVVAIPDSNIWNAQSFRIAVNSLYRQGKALIGFNQSLLYPVFIYIELFYPTNFLILMKSTVYMMSSCRRKPTTHWQPATIHIFSEQLMI